MAQLGQAVGHQPACYSLEVLQLPARIGGYEIVSPIRSGGMATLLLARRRGPAGFSRPVAIKLVHPHLAEDEMFVEMFLDEARLSARITHPNVVHIEELGEENGAYYLAMEYVHGCSLRQLLSALAKANRPIEPWLAVYITCQIAQGLHAAHETAGPDGELLDLVHRDVSPHNVLVSYNGHLKVIDFGIAKAKGRTSDTSGPSLKGKVAYMSPEQAWGEDVDRRSDVYSLAVMLWEMLTMRRLIVGKNRIDTLNRARSPIVRPPSEINPAVSAELESVVTWGLKKARDDRPATMDAFRRGLLAALPRAAVVEASDLKEVIHTVMSPSMKTELAALPEEARTLLTHTGDNAPPKEALTADLRPPAKSAPAKAWRLVLVAAIVAVGLVGVVVAAGWTGAEESQEPRAPYPEAPAQVSETSMVPTTPPEDITNVPTEETTEEPAEPVETASPSEAQPSTMRARSRTRRGAESTGSMMEPPTEPVEPPPPMAPHMSAPNMGFGTDFDL